MTAPDPTGERMDTRLRLDILPQPDDRTCGPTCLHALYRYYFDEMPLEQVVQEVPQLEGGGTLVILKTTYDETIKTISPAFLMREESFRGLFEEQQLTHIEFFGKLMEWHTRWTDDVRTLFHVNYFHSLAALRLKTMLARYIETKAEREVAPQ